MSSTFDRLEAILVKDYKAVPGALRPDTRLEELGIDSLGTVELLWSVEEAFGVKLPPEPVALATAGDVVTYLDALMADTTKTTAPASADPDVAGLPGAAR